VAFIETSAFPVGDVPLTPAAPCCASPGARCADADAWSRNPVWSALDFQVDEPHQFQYGYRSDGKTFSAIAVGDLDCDGTMITYELRGAAPGGNPTLTLTEPAPNTD
jgi:hypothetical protein